MGNRYLTQKCPSKFNKIERELQALERIKELIEPRGKKLQRLMNGEAFKNYDAITFNNQSVYSLDPSGNNKKTIKSDIEFISEWINPQKYLQLLPKCLPFF